MDAIKIIYKKPEKFDLISKYELFTDNFIDDTLPIQPLVNTSPIQSLVDIAPVQLLNDVLPESIKNRILDKSSTNIKSDKLVNIIIDQPNNLLSTISSIDQNFSLILAIGLITFIIILMMVIKY